MSHRPFKDELYDHFARVGKALASPKRLEILDLLAQTERTVEALALDTATTVKNASAHLRILREARLVETRKEPPYVFYRLADAAVAGLVRQLESVAQARLAEVERLVQVYVDDPEELEPIGPEELARRIAEDDVIVLDVRPVEEYRSGHIAGARSMPVAELKARLAELPAGRPVVAYCRGPYCLFSLEAIGMLRDQGVDARRMEAGLPEWRAAGHPVGVGGAP